MKWPALFLCYFKKVISIANLFETNQLKTNVIYPCHKGYQNGNTVHKDECYLSLPIREECYVSLP
jgi:hypothetical protein